MVSSPRARQALLDYSQQKVDADAVMRALIEHEDWHVPVHSLARSVVDQLIIYAQQFKVAPHQLNVFTDRAAADLAAVKFGGEPMGVYAAGIAGVELFGGLLKVPALEPAVTVQVNPGTPTAEQWFVARDAFGLCGVWSEAIKLERAIGATSPGWASAMGSYPAWLAIIGKPDNALVRINKPGKGEHALIFTAPDLADTFLKSLPPAQAAACQASPVPGAQLFRFLAASTVKGFVVNAHSSQARVFDISLCRELLGSQG
jgi:hypothetical protein